MTLRSLQAVLFHELLFASAKFQVDVVVFAGRFEFGVLFEGGLLFFRVGLRYIPVLPCRGHPCGIYSFVKVAVEVKRWPCHERVAGSPPRCRTASGLVSEKLLAVVGQ